jgi:two-component system CitB family sensor kinase
MSGGIGDHTAVLTVVGNLLDNAVDAVTDGPAQTRARQVVVQITQTEQDVNLSVWDNGPGIPQDRLEQVFVDGYSTKAPRGGLRRGVGLALVHRLVARSGGSIVVTSQDGTRFDVRFPLDRLEVVS